MNQNDFQKSVERNLAWILSMEERLGENFSGLRNVFVDYSAPTQFQDSMEVQEANDLAGLEGIRMDEVATVHSRFLERLEQARKQFNSHEVNNSYFFMKTKSMYGIPITQL